MTQFKKLRKEHGYSQKEIAEYLHIKQNTYSQYENEKREMSYKSLIKLANLYDCTIDKLIGRNYNI